MAQENKFGFIKRGNKIIISASGPQAARRIEVIETVLSSAGPKGLSGLRSMRADDVNFLGEETMITFDALCAELEKYERVTVFPCKAVDSQTGEQILIVTGKKKIV